MNVLKLVLVLIVLSILNSCVLDSKPLGYCVKNCTKDTLLIDLSESDTLNNDMYWNQHCKDTIGLISIDTTSVYIRGKKVVIFNFYSVAPGTKSGGFWPMNSDTFYLYTIKWKLAKKIYFRRNSEDETL